MFNFSFNFAAALWALPLAAVPILLHLLFKQKSPVVQFSTLRFIKMSIQRTAARKRVQKWMLLACRALLIALLIWAIAQPKTQLISSFLGGGGGRSISAAIVIDTSYSMQLQDGQVTLLSKADSIVQDLLRDQLAGGKVAIFTSMPAAKPAANGQPERAKDASAWLSEWSPLRPQPSPKPLIERVNAAVNYLDRQDAEQKWLVVISDFQSQEFSHPIPELKDGRTVLMDLHVNDPRSAGITKLAIDPAQPIPGIPSIASVELTGQPGDARAVVLKVETADGNPISQSAPIMATLDSTGRASKQFPVKLPAERWLKMTAELTADDAMAWDNTRTRLIEVPPKQRVGVMRQSAVSISAVSNSASSNRANSIGTSSMSERVLALALDPSEGKLTEWPLAVTKVNAVDPKQDVLVAALSHWPDVREAALLRSFASSGHTLILFLAPGLERSWAALPQNEKDALTDLLPSPPIQRSANSVCRAAVADDRDPVLQGLMDEKFQLNAIVVRQLVPLAAVGDASTILNAVPADPTPGSRTQGLLYRKPVGYGTCFTCATLPDSQFTNLATHPVFLPLLVRMALKTANQQAGQNVELGKPLVLDGSLFPDDSELEILDPRGAPYRVQAATIADHRQFSFNEAVEPGLYQWRKVGNPAVVAMSNVQLPAAESVLTYRTAQSVAPAGPNTVIASSTADLQGKVASMTAAQPQWSIPLAIVMFLLCLEALMGSLPKLWQPNALRAFLPGLKGDAATTA
jgi:hypothetical protein